MPRPDGYTRIYRPGSAVSHLASDSRRIMCRDPSRPGAYYDSERWRGTGSQDEYDRAERLPLCPECARRAALETGCG